jgi:hypothetical protein
MLDMPIFQQLGTLEQKFLVTCWADVAQLVEQPIRNRQVTSSSLVVGSILFVFNLSLHRFFRFRNIS